MVWVVAEFTDATIATVTEQWISIKNGKIYCYWPSKDVEKKNRENAKPGSLNEGTLHECTLLMNGEKFDTYKSAREAEKIAQNHSTMSSFIRSKSSKRPRKRPERFFSSESSEDSETEKKIVKKMENADLRRLTDAKNIYNYTKRTSTPLQNTLNECSTDSSSSSDNISSSKSKKLKYNNQTSTTNNSNQPSGSAIAASNNLKPNQISTEDGKNQLSSSCSSCNSSDDSSSSSNDSDSDSSKSTKCDQPQSLLSPNNQTQSDDENILKQPHSPRFILSPNNQTQSDDANILKVVCEELQDLKKEFKKIAEASKNNTVALQELKETGLSSIVVLKDLTAEVFKCKDEIKKRNGLFTDLLHPDIELPVVHADHYNDVTEKLKQRPVVDNLIKYIATVNNANDEEDFVKGALKTLFKFDFFMKDVTWKPEQDRVVVKKSLLMHCWRESFKLKFGLKEPKKSDKEVNKFIHDVCRRYKDSSRKAKRTDYDF